MQDRRQPNKESTMPSVEQRLSILRATSVDDIAKIIAKDRDERGMNQPSDKVLQNKVYRLKRAIKPRNYAVLSSLSRTSEMAAEMHVSMNVAGSLRSELVSFRLADEHTGLRKTEIGTERALELAAVLKVSPRAILELDNKSAKELMEMLKKKRELEGRWEYADKTLEEKAYFLMALLKYDVKKLAMLASESVTVEECRRSGIQYPEDLRCALGSFGLIKRHNRDTKHYRSRDESTIVLDTLITKIAEMGPVTYRQLAEATGYDNSEVARIVHQMVKQGYARCFGFSRMSIVGDKVYLPRLSNINGNTYIIDDQNPGNLERFKKLVLENCPAMLSLAQRHTFGQLISELTPVLPGAGGAIVELKVELSKRVRAAKA